MGNQSIKKLEHFNIQDAEIFKKQFHKYCCNKVLRFPVATDMHKHIEKTIKLYENEKNNYLFKLKDNFYNNYSKYLSISMIVTIISFYMGKYAGSFESNKQAFLHFCKIIGSNKYDTMCNYSDNYAICAYENFNLMTVLNKNKLKSLYTIFLIASYVSIFYTFLTAKNNHNLILLNLRESLRYMQNKISV